MAGSTNRNPNPPSRGAPGSAEHLAALLKIKETIQAGWAGVLPSGNIVDRREHPSAIPIPENKFFGTPPPSARLIGSVCCGRCGGYLVNLRKTKRRRGHPFITGWCPTCAERMYVVIPPNGKLSHGHPKTPKETI
jgi:hypothetical protein